MKVKFLVIGLALCIMIDFLLLAVKRVILCPNLGLPFSNAHVDMRCV